MKQQSSPKEELELHLNRAERHNTFPARPFDPPSLPPPTSPLPPLPEIAPYSHASSPSILSPTQPISTMSRPIRPPRPQTSLPNLKPRTITSPEISEQQRRSEIAAQARISPRSTSRRQKTSQAEARTPKLSSRLKPVKSVTLTIESASKFSDEVLGALPKLFDKFSYSHSSSNATGGSAGQNERIEPWRVYHGKVVACPGKVLNLDKATRRSVARSALFIPKTPPGKSPQMTSTAPPAETCSLRKEGSCYAIQSRKRTPDKFNARFCGTPSSTRQDHPTHAYHKRSQAVTSFSFDFDNFYAPSPSLMSSDSSENLTSLPRIPSDPILFVDTIFDKEKQIVKVSFPKTPTYHGTSEGPITFAALPYAHTLHSVGPRPRTEKDCRVRFEDTDCDVEVGEAEGRQLTEQEIRSEKQKRILWAIVTIALVILSTSGILTGIVWKLRSLT